MELVLKWKSVSPFPSLVFFFISLSLAGSFFPSVIFLYDNPFSGSAGRVVGRDVDLARSFGLLMKVQLSKTGCVVPTSGQVV